MEVKTSPTARGNFQCPHIFSALVLHPLPALCFVISDCQATAPAAVVDPSLLAWKLAGSQLGENYI